MKYDFDLIVIGGGAAGLTASGMAASFGVKTALIEAKKLGGDCTWYGCVPSKALLKSAKIANVMRTSSKYGIEVDNFSVNFKNVMRRLHHIRQEIYNDADDPEIYKKMGVDVKFGKASFLSEHEIELISENGNEKLSSKYFVIATGSSPVIPSINGIENIEILTNENIFELDKQPKSLIVIGAGPIGIEMGQAFNRLGCDVTIIDFNDTILAKDDQELVLILKEKMLNEGINFKLGSSVESFEKTADGIRVNGLDKLTKENFSLDAENVLIAAGRKSNIESLNLDKINLKTNRAGIIVNSHCRTNLKHIYSCGDVAGRAQFTHYAEHMAKIAISNMILKIPMKLNENNIPWCTYCDPELAHVGMTEDQLKSKKIKYGIYKFPYQKIDRALAESTAEGWIKVFAKESSGKIFGVSIVGEMAGDLISEFALAIKNDVSLRKMADTIHPYPTYGLGNRRAADQWYVRKQSVGFVKVLKKLFGYRGQLPDVSDRERIV